MMGASMAATVSPPRRAASRRNPGAAAGRSGLGGVVFEQFGSYTPIWWLSIMFGVLSALINLPIVEQPVARPVAQPA